MVSVGNREKKGFVVRVSLDDPTPQRKRFVLSSIEHLKGSLGGFQTLDLLLFFLCIVRIRLFSTMLV